MSTWMITATGREHYLSGPMVGTDEVEIYEVAHALAQINRFTGHALRPYSVAEHSLLCADLAALAGERPLVQLLCLMHDAHECATGDVSSPAKIAIGLAWSRFEALQADIFRRRLGLHTAFAAYRDRVHRYDLQALATERAQVTAWQAGRNSPWSILDDAQPPVRPVDAIDLRSIERQTMDWQAWRRRFLERYRELTTHVYASQQSLETAEHDPA